MKFFSHPFLRGKLFLCCITVSVVSALAAASIYWQWGISSGRWQNTREELKSAYDSSIAGFTAMDELFTAAMREENPTGYAPSAIGFHVRSQAAAYFKDFVKNNASGASQARACYLLGQYDLREGAMGLAEKRFRKARHVYAELARKIGDPELHFRLAQCNNCLCLVLANKGDFKRARQVAGQARELLLDLVAHFPNRPAIRSAFAVACNNSGMLAAAVGNQEEAQRYLGQHLSILQQWVNLFPRDGAALARLIDAQQHLTAVWLRHGRLHEAHAVCKKSIAALELLDDLREDLPAHSLGIAGAQKMALANLCAIEAAIKGKPNLQSERQSESNRQIHFAWRSLSPTDGASIAPDLLAAGILPADFEQHEALLLSYNWADANWWEKTLVNIVAAAEKHIAIIILVPDSAAQKLLTDRLRQAKVSTQNLRFHQIPTDSIWVRDYGPLVVNTDLGCRFADAPYVPHRFRDDAVPAALAYALHAANLRVPLPLQGGCLLSNGQGICVATKKLLQDNAKLGNDKEYVSKSIQRLFGADQVVYLDALAGEPTAHADMFAVFTSPDTIVIGEYSGIESENAAILDRNAQRLRKVKTSSGPLRVVRIPMPRRGKDSFIPTYTNVVFANRVVLVPHYAHVAAEMERRALDIYRRLLPGWQVVTVASDEIGWRRGALRCATMQLHRLTSH